MTFSPAAVCGALMFIWLAIVPLTSVAEDKANNVLYSIDFTQQPDGSAIEWLKQNGFILALDAEKLNPRFENHQLVISTDDTLAGIIGLKLVDSIHLRDVERVEIEWGVARYPEGVNWEQGNNRVAVAVMIFFGTEKLSSGLPFGINAAPYFFSPFVSKTEPHEKMYLGKLYKKGGRYYSIVAPQEITGLFVTDFELKERFQKAFNKKHMPAVSAIAFQMNTEDTKGGAIASIRRISFLGK